MIQPEQLKQKIKELIAEGYPGQALKLLESPELKYLEKDITLIRSRLSSLKRDRMQGVLEPGEEKREMARINRDIIDLLDSIKATPTNDPKRTKYFKRNLIIGVSVLIVGVLCVFAVQHFAKPAPKPAPKSIDFTLSMSVPFPGKIERTSLMDTTQLNELKAILFEQSFPSENDANKFIKDYNLPEDISSFHLQKNGDLIPIENSEEIKIISELGIGMNDTLSLYQLDTIQPPKPGTLDTTFGSSGISIIKFEDKYHFLKSISILSNDNILVAGWAGSNLAMSRLAQNGKSNTDFGDGGQKMTDVSFDILSGGEVAVQSNGRLVFSGSSKNLPYTQTSNAFSVRFFPDGKDRDKSFGKGVQVPNSNYYGYAWSFEIGRGEFGYGFGLNQKDGFAQTGINAQSRHLFISTFDKNGKPNTAFGEKGYKTYQIGDADSKGNDLVYLEDGKILVAGSAGIFSYNCRSMLLRVHPDGQIDNSFGINGTVILENEMDKVKASFDEIKIQPDGKILCLGEKVFKNKNSVVLMRFKKDGKIDTSFGNNGNAIFTEESQAFYGNSIFLQPDGKICIVGKASSDKSNKNVVAVSRFNADGKTDINFGDNGIVKIEDMQVREQVFIGMQKTGKLIVAGTATDNSHFCVARIESGYYPVTDL